MFVAHGFILPAAEAALSLLRQAQRIADRFHLHPEVQALQDTRDLFHIDSTVLLLDALGVQLTVEEWQHIQKEVLERATTEPIAKPGPQKTSDAVVPFQPAEAVVPLQPAANNDAKVRMLQMKIKHLQQQNRRLRERLKTTSSPPIQDQCHFDLQRTGKHQRYLSKEGTIALAVRRNLGNTSCSSIGCVLLQDISKDTVARAECKTGSALVASARAWYQSAMADLDASADEFNLVVHGFRSDATNSGIWQRRKLWSMELESLVLAAVPEDTSTLDRDWLSGFDHIKRMSDVNAVGDPSGQGALGQLLKGFASLGCPTWLDVLDRAESPQEPEVHWYCFTSDCGPDQQAAKQLIQVSLESRMDVIFISFDCLEHQDHLIGHGALKRIDAALKDRGTSWRYYSSLAKIANVWRSSCPDIYREWQRQYGLESARKHALKLMPKCCSGRRRLRV